MKKSTILYMIFIILISISVKADILKFHDGNGVLWNCAEGADYVGCWHNKDKKKNNTVMIMIGEVRMYIFYKKELFKKASVIVGEKIISCGKPSFNQLICMTEDTTLYPEIENLVEPYTKMSFSKVVVGLRKLQ